MSHHSQILTFKIVDLEKVGQDHGVQLLQLSHSMMNIKINKCNFYIFDFLQDTTCTNESNSQTHKEMDKSMAIEKFLQITKNVVEWIIFSS